MPASTFQARVKEALDAGVIQGDGHTLFAPSFYEPHFTSEELKEANLVQVHHSDGTYKGSIWSADGTLIEKVEAVYNLHFLYWVARQVGVTEKVRSMGRGFQAEELVEYISKAIAA